MKVALGIFFILVFLLGIAVMAMGAHSIHPGLGHMFVGSLCVSFAGFCLAVMAD